MHSSKFKLLNCLGRLLILVLLIFVVAKSINFATIKKIWHSANLLLLSILIILVAVVPTFINAAKLKYMFFQQKNRYIDLVSANLISNVFSLITPATIGEEMSRLYLIGANNGYALSAVVLILDRLSCFAMQVCFTLITFVVWGAKYFIFSRRIIISATGIAITAALLLLLYRTATLILKKFSTIRLKNQTIEYEKILPFIQELFRNRKAVYGIMGFTFLFQLFLCIMIILLSKAWKLDISLFEASAIMLSFSAIVFIPITFAGIGLVEGIYMVLFGAIFSQAEIGLVIALSFRMSQILAACTGLIIIGFRKIQLPFLKGC